MSYAIDGDEKHPHPYLCRRIVGRLLARCIRGALVAALTQGHMRHVHLSCGRMRTQARYSVSENAAHLPRTVLRALVSLR